jgi:hypothetical protein
MDTISSFAAASVATYIGEQKGLASARLMNSRTASQHQDNLTSEYSAPLRALETLLNR